MKIFKMGLLACTLLMLAIATTGCAGNQFKMPSYAAEAAGGVVGAVIGSQVADEHEVAGAAVGAAAGVAAGHVLEGMLSKPEQ